MKLSLFLALISVITLVGYIAYNESKPLIIYPPEISGEVAFGKSFTLPDSMTFASEHVPMEQPDVMERLDRELHINSYWHNNTIFLLKRSGRWFPEIESILKEEGIPDDFKYLTTIEGSLRNDVSPRNAVGFWQIRKATGKELGLEITSEVDERYDPIKSTWAACKYLNKAKNKFGNWTMVAASYNRGMAGMSRAIKNQEEENYYNLLLNQETSRYLFRILAIKEIFENPSKYSFDISEEHMYKPYSIHYLEVNKTVDDLVAFSKENGITYKTLKYYNPWLRKDKLTVRKGKSYQIALPDKIFSSE